MGIQSEKYVAFTTFRKNGERKTVPVWIAETADGTVGFTTGDQSWKLRRLNNDPRCELQPCDQRGRVTEGSNIVTGTARQATDAEFAAIKNSIREKYGIATKLIPMVAKVASLFKKGESGEAANTGVVVTLDS